MVQMSAQTLYKAERADFGFGNMWDDGAVCTMVVGLRSVQEEGKGNPPGRW